MPPVAASVSMHGCAATWRLCGIERAFSARCSISSAKIGADLLDASWGLTRASIFFRKKMDCRVTSAFTRVHSPSKTGVNALEDALCPAMTAEGSVQTLRSKSSGDEVHLSPVAQPCEQLRRRPSIGREAELDLRVADGDAALEAEHAVDATDVVAALFQKLLQFAGFLERDFRNVRAAPVHGRRAVEARRIVGCRQRIVERLVPLQIGLEIVVGEEGGSEPSQRQHH